MLKNGCKPIINNQFEKTYQCGNSFVIKSPSSQYSLLVPSDKLNNVALRVKSDNIQPISIDSGQIVRNNGWSQMFGMQITNQLQYKIPENKIREVKDPIIQRIMSEMEDQKKLIGEEVYGFDIQKDYKQNGWKIADRINSMLVEDIKKKNVEVPITCNSKPIFHKYWSSSEGEGMAFKIISSCIIPNTKKEIDDVIDPFLEQGKVSQYNVRYINSKMTHDKNFLLNGINLYQGEGIPPMLKFIIRDEKTILDNNFIQKVEDLEKNFNKAHSQKLSDIDPEIFTKFLQWG